MAYNFMILADDFQLIENKLLEIQKGYSMEDEKINYQLSEENLYSLIDELSTVSLFDTPKFVVARGAEELLKKNDASLSELVKVMNDHESQNVLVLIFTGAIDYNNLSFQRLKRCSTIFDLKSKNINLEEYARNCLESDGYQIDEQPLHLLISYTDTLSKLQNTLDLLESYKLEDRKITTEDIQKMVCEPLDDNVYALIEAVLSNNKRWMLKGYRDLKLKSVLASNLISMLINKFQELYNVSILIKGGINQTKLAELLNVSSGRAYYMMKNAKDTNLSTICKHLDQLNQLDYQIKSGKMDANLGLELYFLN